MDMYKEALEEVMEIIEHSVIDDNKKAVTPLLKVKSNFNSTKKVSNERITSTDMGYCIRCNTSIDFNEEKPYCYECFKSWSKFQNEDYEEKFCHECGVKADTSLADPLCFICN
jgi:hypothetical protein